jgi:cyclic-di-GMP-binding protein
VADLSFDVVSKVNRQEVQNALLQAKREIGTRFDFKGTETTIEPSGDAVVIRSSTEQRAAAALDVFKERLAKRSVSLKALEASPPRPAGKSSYRIECSFVEGIPEDKAKAMAKAIRQAKLKVQAQVQGDQLRVTGKSKDDLQRAIRLLKDDDHGLALQFTNYR